MSRHQEDIARWRSTGEPVIDPGIFRTEVLPRLREVPIRRMMEATGLSEAYCYRVRRAEAIPHARHWKALLELGTARDG